MAHENVSGNATGKGSVDKAYMDYQSASPADPRVVEAMLPFMHHEFGNPASMHSWSRGAKRILGDARENIAKLVGSSNPETIVFTASATESNNLALRGAAHRLKKKGKHIVTSNIEHWSVHTPLKSLQKEGFEVTEVSVDENGLVMPGDVESAMRDDTILVSMMAANNEIGTIQDLEKIANTAHSGDAVFHTDATCAVGKMPLGVEKMGIDMLTLSSNDIYGPKGIAALYVRKGLRLEPIIYGGGQEFGMRSGTENIPGMAGFSRASEIMLEEMPAEVERMRTLRDRLTDSALMVPGASLNGCRNPRLPNNVNVRFSFIEGESLILGLDSHGIAASSGSACSSKTLEPSHVLLAIGLSHEVAHGSVQFSLGRWSTMEHVEKVMESLPLVVERLQRMSPLAPAGWIEEKYGGKKQ